MKHSDIKNVVWDKNTSLTQ